MPLLDHFHPPLHGPRRWEGFHHAWATSLAQQLNLETLPENYYAEPDYCVGQRAEIETCVYAKPSNDPCAAVKLVTPLEKADADSRRAFAAKSIDSLKRGVGIVIVDVVTLLAANLHDDLVELLMSGEPGMARQSSTGLYTVAYRIVPGSNGPRLEVWAETLTLGKALPVMPLWLSPELCVPVRLEDSYLTAYRSLRISA